MKIEKKGKKRKAKDITKGKEGLEETYNSEDSLELQKGREESTV